MIYGTKFRGVSWQSNVFVFWAKGSWLVGPEKGTRYDRGYFKGAFNGVGDLEKGSWLQSEAENTDAVLADPTSEHWEASKMKLSPVDCSQMMFYSTSTTTSTSTTSTTSTSSTTTSVTYAVDCSDNLDIKWVESTAALEFYGETSALVSVSLTSVDQIVGEDIAGVYKNNMIHIRYG